MEDNNNELELNLSNVLVIILSVFAIVGVFALIWAKWKVMQLSFSIVIAVGLILALVPDKYLK